MAKGGLSVRRHIEGIGEGSVVGTLTRLLQLTCEAVLVFDGAGRVLLANDGAAELFGQPALAGADVRTLFLLPDGSAPKSTDFSPADLPFASDGSTNYAFAHAARGQVGLRVRCEQVKAPGETYLLVAIPASPTDLADQELDRALRDLKRANRRLSGALNIVLDTLDSPDVATLFDRMLEEITQTMEADGTLVYLGESDGFHLRGVSNKLEGEKFARFMPFDHALERIIFAEGHAVRLRVPTPTGADLRRGRLSAREVVIEETHDSVRLSAKHMPPFTSMICVPIWFGGHIIAIIIVGWYRLRPLLKDDAQLLDSVGRYLSVQLAGAFTTLRTQRAEKLQNLLADLREALLSADSKGPGDADRSERLGIGLNETAQALEASFVPLMEGASPKLVLANFPEGGIVELKIDVAELERGLVVSDVAVVALVEETGVPELLRSFGQPSVGVLVDLGIIAERRRFGLFLRPDGSEPFNELELDFLQSLGEDVRRIVLGEEQRGQDKHISQALQSGMKNELQDVPGITAQGVYSSATASAFVGGDFYDLIRLPDRKACVIMGDVSGKGVEAASVSAAVKTALGAYAWEGLAPARMVRSLNDFLLGFSRLETFATLFVGIIDLKSSTITYCSAGHPPAILVGANASRISILDVQSGVVGAFKNMTYTNGKAKLHPGDVLLLYTDGTTEARSPSGDFFGEQGLRDMVMRESEGEKPFDGFLGRLLRTLDDFTGQHLEDDVAMVALRFDELGKQ